MTNDEIAAIEKESELRAREMGDTLQQLYNEIELLITYCPRGHNGKRLDRRKSLAVLNMQSDTVKGQPKYRMDGLIAGSKEAIAAMAKLAASEAPLFGSDDAVYLTDDEIELRKGTVSLFKGV